VHHAGETKGALVRAPSTLAPELPIMTCPWQGKGSRGDRCNPGSPAFRRRESGPANGFGIPLAGNSHDGSQLSSSGAMDMSIPDEAKEAAVAEGVGATAGKAGEIAAAGCGQAARKG